MSGAATAARFPGTPVLALRWLRSVAARRAAAKRRRLLRRRHADVLAELAASGCDPAVSAEWAVRFTAAIHDATEAEVLDALGAKGDGA